MNESDKCFGCGAQCCKEIHLFYSADSLSEDVMIWYAYHKGVSVKMTEDNLYRIILPIECEQLDEDGSCKVHGTWKQPGMCKMFDCEKPECRFTRKIKAD